MKFTTTNEQQKNFQKNRVIEFDGFLSLNQLNSLNDIIDNTIAKRMDIPQDTVEEQLPEKIFLASRDLWRSSPELKKSFFQKNWAEIAAELTGKTVLKIAYDQLLVSPNSLLEPSPFSQMFQQLTTLAEISTIQGLICGLMICLNCQDPLSSDPHEVFPTQPGNAIYFLPTASIDFPKFCQERSGKFLLIVYTQSKSNYIFQPKDPNTHFLKKLGYVFGDPLQEGLHPVVYRK